MIEPGVVPRARVMDQTRLDRYLMDGVITPRQHTAGMVIHRHAYKAGMFPKGQDYTPKIKTPPSSRVLVRKDGFGKISRRIAKHLSPEHLRVTTAVICFDADVSGESMTRLRQTLNYVDANYSGSDRDPLALLEMNRPKKTGARKRR